MFVEASADQFSSPLRRVIITMSDYMAASGLKDREVISVLLERMERADYVGLDWSTISYNPTLLRIVGMGQSIPVFSRLWPLLVRRIEYYSGHRIHWLLRPSSCRFAKGLALVLSACAHLYSQASQEERTELLTRANHIGTLIEEKRLPNRILWAHDYDYLIHNIVITTQTPNLVTTAFVAQSFWDWWRAAGVLSYKRRFLEIVEDMVRVFPVQPHDHTACFMYTPNTQYHVHNANLLASELLAKRFSIEKDEEYIKLIEMTVTYSLDDFRESGSFPYAGPPTENPAFDNIHTGYVLRSLNDIARCIPELADRLGIQETLRKGILFYLEKFVREGRVWRDGSARIMETHSLAEAILVHKELGHLLTSEQKEKLGYAIITTARRLWRSDKKYFINNVKRLPFGLGCLEDRTDMIRWSQAWMVYALSCGYRTRAR
jgi:hypothetical protein